MANKIGISLTASELADALGLVHVGEDLAVEVVSPATVIAAGSLFFSKAPVDIVCAEAATGIVSEACVGRIGAALISRNPRLDFARALRWIQSRRGFVDSSEDPVVHPSARIGHFVTLNKGVVIGAETVIENNVVVGAGVEIGARCVVKSGAVIGEDGFGFERDELGRPIRLIHLGSVVIGDDVEIGSLTTVCRGTLGNTVIEDFAKIDDHVHIAHNVVVRTAALITACAEVSGGVVIGERAWIGPNASIIQKVSIGADALVGIGANVIRDVPAGVTVAGNPARQVGQ